MSIKKTTIRDSRGVEWNATVSGPTSAGNLPENRELSELPKQWRVHFHRSDREGAEITVFLSHGDSTDDELRRELEREPEWIHEHWAKP